MGSVSAASSSPRVAGRSWNLLSAAACLIGVVLFALIPAAWYAHGQHGQSGMFAVALAAVVCGGSGLIALILSSVFAGAPNGAVVGLLFGMLFRMGVPLVAGTILAGRGGPLAEAGVFGWIVVFYLITLLTETLLSLQLMKQHQPRKAD